MPDSEVITNGFAIEVVIPRTAAATDQGDVEPDDLTREAH